MLNSFHSISQGRELYVILWVMYPWHCPASKHLWTDLFQMWYDARHNWILQYDSSLNDFDFSLKATWLQDSWNLCNHFVVKWHEVTQTFAMFDCVKEMTSKKTCKYGENGLFEHCSSCCTCRSTKKVPGDSGPDLPTSDECSDCRAKMVFMPGSGMAYYECSACRSRKVTVPSSVVSRVIGRGGCNINSIRESSGAHVDIEKSQKGAVDRVITIKWEL